jgi:AcrR family transcriptional regulator
MIIEETPSKEDMVHAQILQAAKKLFATYGLAKITMEDIAKAIRKTRGSIYYYYKSKEEIVYAVIDLEIKEVRSAMEEAVSQASGTHEKISAFFVSKLQMSRTKYSFFDALESGMDSDSISNFKTTQNHHHERTLSWEGALLRQILMEGITNGELKAIDENAFDSIIFTLLSSLHGLKREMRLENNVREIELVIKQFTKMIYNGLGK